VVTKNNSQHLKITRPKSLVFLAVDYVGVALGMLGVQSVEYANLVLNE
jgi:hypothetical protein